MKAFVKLGVFLILVGTTSCAARGGGRVGADWVPLGQREVSDRLERDQIAVTARRGDFRRIKLTVQRNPVDFHRVVVRYRNGPPQEIAMRSTIRAGGETRAIDLAGGDRIIRVVEFFYDANTMRGRTAVVRLFGRR